MQQRTQTQQQAACGKAGQECPCCRGFRCIAGRCVPENAQGLPTATSTPRPVCTGNSSWCDGNVAKTCGNGQIVRLITCPYGCVNGACKSQQTNAPAITKPPPSPGGTKAPQQAITEAPTQTQQGMWCCCMTSQTSSQNTNTCQWLPHECSQNRAGYTYSATNNKCPSQGCINGGTRRCSSDGTKSEICGLRNGILDWYTESECLAGCNLSTGRCRDCAVNGEINNSCSLPCCDSRSACIERIIGEGDTCVPKEMATVSTCTSIPSAYCTNAFNCKTGFFSITMALGVTTGPLCPTGHCCVPDSSVFAAPRPTAKSTQRPTATPTTPSTKCLVNGRYRCLNNKVQKCVDHKWEDQETCTSGNCVTAGQVAADGFVFAFCRSTAVPTNAPLKCFCADSGCQYGCTWRREGGQVCDNSKCGASPTLVPTVRPGVPTSGSQPTLPPPPPAPTSPSGPGPGPGPSCAYNSLQARVQPNAQTNWSTTLTISQGGKVNLGCMGNGSGQLANNVKIVVDAVLANGQTFHQEWQQNSVNQWEPASIGNYRVWCQTVDGCINSGNDSAVLTVSASATGCKPCPDGSLAPMGTTSYSCDTDGKQLSDFNGWKQQYQKVFYNNETIEANEKYGDFNCDGKVDPLDFGLWKERYVTTL